VRAPIDNLALEGVDERVRTHDDRTVGQRVVALPQTANVGARDVRLRSM
jgi:hypothetical protein